jgi:2-polyprenyl-6-methoxyphenol hydroxylase-like FAD-dependent oxidoreductase
MDLLCRNLVWGFEARSGDVKVFIAGGGPAGLTAAILIARRRPDARITLVEQNPAGATFGFGVVFSEQALGFLREDAPEIEALLTPQMETWRDLTLVHRGENVRIDGIGFAAIGRLTLLKALQARLAALPVDAHYATTLDRLPELASYDLVIAADGVNSRIRSTYADAFGTSIRPLTNRFVWYGTTHRYSTLTQTFIETAQGAFNAHHYRYAPDASTFIVECDAASFDRAGFATLSEAESRQRCEALFSDALDGAPLIANKSTWRQFPQLTNAHWHYRNVALVGDALRTAHFSIGSGTRLALEDVIALVKALDTTDYNVARALPAYEAARRPIVDKIVGAAEASALWYEGFAEHMRLEPMDFAWSYIQRSGRIDIERLRRLSPRFVAAYEASRSQGGQTHDTSTRAS